MNKQATPQEQPLSGQQMQAMAARYADELGKIRRDIETRKFAVTRVIDLLAVPGTQVTMGDALKMIRDVHAFLVEAADGKTDAA